MQHQPGIPLDIAHTFQLTPEQAAAAGRRGENLIVTAGAGSGKTRTLVARYISLLAEGHPPTGLVAITFTEKAAREMRSRVRQFLTTLQSEAADPAADFWQRLEAGMDAARIGTIHSLCSEILRSHPAEAGIDPQFEVLEEGLAAALKARVIEDSLAWASGQVSLRPLWAVFSAGALAQLAQYGLQNRLDLSPTALQRFTYTKPGGGLSGDALLGSEALHAAGQEFLDDPDVVAILDTFAGMRRSGALEVDAGPSLAAQVEGLLAAWEACRQFQTASDVPAALQILAGWPEHMGLRAGKRDSHSKESLRELRSLYEARLKPWLEGGLDPQAEAACLQTMPLLQAFLAEVIAAYERRLGERYALDFDDLEGKALQLLQLPEVRRRWQTAISSLLVDEFQDTNERQRQIIEALAGEQPGRLFAVGDDRQSIYRFRGADVTVFRGMQRQMKYGGGQTLMLNRTFRGHFPLLQATGDLLDELMAPDRQPPPAYWVGYSPLEAVRQAPTDGSQPPHVEFILGTGASAAAGRRAAALALCRRLLSLKEEGQIRSWEDAALLFRASSAFPFYEDALEQARIPYVTVAGRGFYDRPEIRDLINILRALADPWDDLALAGLLRSPAFGLTDEALYRLRWPGQAEGPPRSLRLALDGDLAELDEANAAIARRAAAFLDALVPQVNRLPVAGLLKNVLAACDYRAVLAGGRSRLWRNVDKLLADAHTSRLVNLRAFLEYLQTLRDVGAREGEAPVEAQGAVQLMTIHKAKGLEFPVVVIADAAYSGNSRSQAAYWLPRLGLAARFDRFDLQPAFYRLLKYYDAHQELAEERRLLYVAATRAREKLLVSGHISSFMSGWLKDLQEAAGLDLKTLAGQARRGEEARQQVRLPSGETVAAFVAPENQEPVTNLPAEAQELPDEADLPEALPQPIAAFGSGSPLLHPLVPAASAAQADEVEAESDEALLSPWRVTGETLDPRAVGRIIHRALQRWRFPGDPQLPDLLRTAATAEGLVAGEMRRLALQQAERLLNQLRQDAFSFEVEAALERYHEVPYMRATGEDRIDWGYIDLIYRTPAGWRLVEFKTDALRTPEELEQAVERYQGQVRRYRSALTSLLGRPGSAGLLFLDYQRGVRWVEIT